MLQKSKKEAIVKDLEKIATDSASIVFVNFRGLNVADETILRNNLRDKKIGYRVSRKTLLKRALAGRAEGEIPELSGEIAVAFSPEDGLISAQEIYNFQRTHDGILSIVGGIFEGKFIGAEKMRELAMIPSREVLYAQFANLLNSPLQRLAVALNEIAKTPVRNA